MQKVRMNTCHLDFLHYNRGIDVDLADEKEMNVIFNHTNIWKMADFCKLDYDLVKFLIGEFC